MQELRLALRQLRTNPGFAFTAVFVLALGMASSVAIFAFVDAALLQPLPYRNPSRLVAAYESASNCRVCDVSYQDYLDWKRDNTVFQSLDVWDFSVFLWRSPSGVQGVRSAHVSGGFFRTLEVTPLLGRSFSDADDTPAAPRTVMLTYGAWQSRFGGRPDIVGQSLILTDSAYTVIGVLPREFHFALRAAEFFAPIHDPNDCQRDRGCHGVYGIGRLKDGVSVEAASANLKAMAARLEKEYPESNRGRGALAMPLSEAVVGDVRPSLLVLSTAAGLLLLMAWVNVAGLLLVRAENRRREMALRTALGASPGRLARLFVAEGVVLAMCGVGLGLTAAYAAIPRLFQLIPERLLRGMPYFREVGLHPRVWGFAGMVAVLAVAVFAVTPALRLPRANLRDDLAEGGRGSAGTTWRRLGANLVAIEMAIAMVLLAGAGLLGKSLYRLLHVDLNFHPEHVATLEINSPPAGYATEEQRIGLSRRLVERIAAVPGVVSVGHTNELPVTCNCGQTTFRVMGQAWYGEHSNVVERTVSTEYFRVLEAGRIGGRFLTGADDGTKPRVAVVNQALVRQFFAGEDPVGRTIGDRDLAPGSLRRIVGVVEDIREGGLEERIEPAMYVPFLQETERSFFVVVRTAQDAAAMLPMIVSAIHQGVPDAGVRNEFSMVQHLDNSPTAFLNRSSAWLVGGFAVPALLLGAVGLYGVMAYSVSRRTREIGVRMALGAQPGAVYRLILREAGMVAAVGMSAGLAGSVAAAGLLRNLLFGIPAWDVATLAGVAAVLGACALLAGYLPARRAASVNPVEALRAE